MAVVFTGEQCAELLLRYGLLELLEAVLKLLEHGLVIFLDRHLADGQQVVAQRAHPAIRLDLALERAHAGDDLLALLRVVPEAGLGGLDLELLYLALRLLDAERPAEVSEQHGRVARRNHGKPLAEFLHVALPAPAEHIHGLIRAEAQMEVSDGV